MKIVLEEMKYGDAILNDFFHVKQIHILNENEDESIWEYMSKYVGCTSNVMKCNIYKRNDRDRDDGATKRGRESAYTGYYESQEIATLQIMDSIHSYLVHHKQRKYAKIHRKMEEKNENNMDIEDVDIDEKMAINTPKKLEVNTRITNKYVTKVTDDKEFKSLNFGVFFSYNGHQKGEDLTTIKPKYNKLKDELLNNTIYAISEYQWMDVWIRCTKIKSTLYAKQTWRANDNGMLNASCGIPAGSPISIDQLIALFVCINFENLSKLFISNACRLNNEEPLENLRKRHCEISIWSRKLRQSVWYFGNFCKSTEYFYHGFNKKILFGNFHVTIEMPLFVTKDLDLLSENHDGIIFKLSADTGSAIGYPYFDTSFMNDYNHNTNDKEAIFYHCNLQLNDIFYQYQSYSTYLKSLYLFEKITKGYYFNDMLDDNYNKHQNYIIDMINGHWFMNTHSNNHNGHNGRNGMEIDNINKQNNNSNNNKIPPYIQQLFEYYTDNKSTDIWFIPSEFNKLSESFKRLFFDSKNGKYGQFLNVWKNSNKALSIKFVHEFKWQIANDVLLQFHNLQLEQAMTGPFMVCDIDIKSMLNDERERKERRERKGTDESQSSNDTIDDDEDVDLQMKMNQNDGNEGEEEEKNDNNNQDQVQSQPIISMDSCAIFIPYCRKSTKRDNEYGEFGLVLQKLPMNVTAILFEYEVYCPQASYSLCVPPQKWMNVGENVAFTSFKTEKVNNLPFTYNVALKIKQIKCCK